jgi:hypothetical protein
MDRPTREFALQLMASKEKMESELVELLDVLKSVCCSNKLCSHIKVL